MNRRDRADSVQAPFNASEDTGNEPVEPRETMSNGEPSGMPDLRSQWDDGNGEEERSSRQPARADRPARGWSARSSRASRKSRRGTETSRKAMDGLGEGGQTGSEWEDHSEPQEASGEPARPARATARRMTSRPSIRASAFAPRTMPRGRSVPVSMPRILEQSRLLRDQLSVILLGATLFSLLLMWITVVNRTGSLPETMVLRYDAEGLPAWTGDGSLVLRLPVLASFVTIMNLVVAWAVAEADRFAGRFMLAGALLIQALIWIAVIALVW